MSNKVQGLIWDIEFPPGHAKLIALKLADNASDEGDNIYPSNMTTARKVGCSKSTVCKVQAAMEHCGMLRTVNRSAGGNSRETSRRAFDMTLLKRLAWPDRYTPSELILREVEIERPAQREDGSPVMFRDAPKMVKVSVFEAVPRVAPVRQTDPLPVRQTDGSNLDPSDDRTPTGPMNGPTGPTVGPKPFTNHQKEPFDSPPPPSRGKGGKIQPSDWIRELEAEGRGALIVKHLLKPLVASLTVDHPEPIGLLRDIRDQRVIVELPAKVLDRLALRLKETRKKLISTKDVTDMVPDACKGFAMITLYPESPSWNAWCDNLNAQGFAAVAKFYTNQGSMPVWSEWPPAPYGQEAA